MRIPTDTVGSGIATSEDSKLCCMYKVCACMHRKQCHSVYVVHAGGVTVVVAISIAAVVGTIILVSVVVTVVLCSYLVSKKSRKYV